MATYYYSTPGGGLAYRETLADVTPVVPEDWTPITKGSYGTQLAAVEAADKASQDAQRREIDVVRKTAYDQMKGSRHFEDLSDETIRLITGWNGA